MARVFICYRRVDSGDAGRLQAHLRHLPGIELQFDINSIRGGENFVDKLKEELAAADLMIVVIARTWVDALKAREKSDPEDFVQTEVATALTRGIPILPVRVQGAPTPTASDLPDSMKGLAPIQSLELRHERYDDDLALLIGRLRELLDLPSTGPLPADEAAQLALLQTHLEYLRKTGSWATMTLSALAVIATFVIVEPAVAIATQVSQELADAITRLNLKPDEAFPGTASSVAAADPGGRVLPSATLQSGSRAVGDPALAAQELPEKIGRVVVVAWSFLPAASLTTILSVAGVVGSVLPAGAIAVILFVRLKGRRLAKDLASWFESRRNKASGDPASRVRPAPASHVFEMIRAGHYTDVLGTPVVDRPPIVALVALLSLCAMAAYVTVLVYLGSQQIASSIVVTALPLMITVGSLWMIWTYCNLTWAVTPKRTTQQ
jgi:hypothetical protein